MTREAGVARGVAARLAERAACDAVVRTVASAVGAACMAARLPADLEARAGRPAREEAERAHIGHRALFARAAREADVRLGIADRAIGAGAVAARSAIDAADLAGTRRRARALLAVAAAGAVGRRSAHALVFAGRRRALTTLDTLVTGVLEPAAHALAARGAEAVGSTHERVEADGAAARLASVAAELAVTFAVARRVATAARAERDERIGRGLAVVVGAPHRAARAAVAGRACRALHAATIIIQVDITERGVETGASRVYERRRRIETGIGASRIRSTSDDKHG